MVTEISISENFLEEYLPRRQLKYYLPSLVTRRAWVRGSQERSWKKCEKCNHAMPRYPTQCHAISRNPTQREKPRDPVSLVVFSEAIERI